MGQRANLIIIEMESNHCTIPIGVPTLYPKTYCRLTRSTPQLQAQLKDILLREYGCSPVETLLKIAEEGRDKGEEVTISEWALRDDRLEINLIDRQTIFMALGNEGENAS